MRLLDLLLSSCILVVPCRPTTTTTTRKKLQLEEGFVEGLEGTCPQLDPTVHEGAVPAGRMDDDLIEYERSRSAGSTEECVEECCRKVESCQVAFFFRNRTAFACYLADCLGKDENCLPAAPAKPLADGSVAGLVVVRRSSPRRRPTCEGNAAPCPPNSACRGGTCRCNDGFVAGGEEGGDACAEAKAPAAITVEVASKNITLPTDSVTLMAYTIPEDDRYVYVWKLLSGPEADEAVESQDGASLKLSKLREGRYNFKVAVKARGKGDVVGEATCYVQVQQERANAPPKAKVDPEHQVVVLPTKRAIVDGGGSSDDSGSKGLKFKWELETSVLAYGSKDLLLPETPILTLDDLISGNYTIRLTVTDGDGASDSALSYLAVVEEPDYPPTANAGEDVIVYLPTNSLDIHGNGSSDDHGIASWEWSRSGGDGKQLPVDTKNSRDPVLHLSNLEEGTYTFTLTVKDGKGQSGEDSVTVYVKPPSNLPPVADPGKDGEISLPRSWILLDGSKSTDDVGITSYLWTQGSGGPSDATVIVNDTSAVANATGLTKGGYSFVLKVGDASGNFAEASVNVTVKQDANAAPVAFAGEDFAVTLPRTVVLVDGSGSRDDLGIAKWQWSRLPDSLAAGTVLGNTSRGPILQLSDLVPGKYLFQLTVWDEQGKSSKDSVAVEVLQSPHRLDVVEAVLNEQLGSLTDSRLENLRQSFNLLLSDQTDDRVVVHHVDVLRLYAQPHSGNAAMHFLIEKELKGGRTEIMKGTEVVGKLQDRLRLGQDVLKVQFLELDTLHCQNDCSGHGACEQATRNCICEPFWMQNFVRRWLMDGKRNCEWSVVYVSIFASACFMGIICFIVYKLCSRRRGSKGKQHGSTSSRSSRSKRRYSRLPQTELGSRSRSAAKKLSMFNSNDDRDDDSSSSEIFFDSDALDMQPIRGNGATTAADPPMANGLA